MAHLMRKPSGRNYGFTLTEILIAVAIVAILASISVPAYKSYMIKVRRSDAHVALTRFAMAMERQYVRDSTYNVSPTVAVVFQDLSDEGFYRMNWGTVTTTTFILFAIPSGVQADDTECGQLTLNQLGAKGITGTQTVAHCWR